MAPPDGTAAAAAGVDRKALKRSLYLNTEAFANAGKKAQTIPKAPGSGTAALPPLDLDATRIRTKPAAAGMYQGGQSALRIRKLPVVVPRKGGLAPIPPPLETVGAPGYRQAPPASPLPPVQTKNAAGGSTPTPVNFPGSQRLRRANSSGGSSRGHLSSRSSLSSAGSEDSFAAPTPWRERDLPSPSGEGTMPDSLIIQPTSVRPAWEHNPAAKLGSPGAPEISDSSLAGGPHPPSLGGGEGAGEDELLLGAGTVEPGGKPSLSAWYEFMHLLRSAKNPKEFIYLNAASINSPGYTGNPYDLEIVPHGSVDKDDFYTMSALGVTHFHKGNAEFTPLDQWEREYFLYNQISNLAVFKNFRKWKTFKTLKQAVRRKKKKHSRDELEQNLFILDDIYREPLLMVREECWKLQQLRLHSLQHAELYTLREFQAAQAAQAEVARERLAGFSSTITSHVRKLCHKVVDALEHRLFGADNLAMKGSLQPGAQERFAAAKRLLEQEFQDREGEDAKMRTTTYNAGLSSSVNSGLAAETGDDGMKFSYAITVAKRAEQKRILSFIHLADYMIANALHRILIDSMQDMLRILAPPKPPPKVEPSTPAVTPQEGSTRPGLPGRLGTPAMHAMSVAAGFSDEKTIFQVDLLLEGSQVVFQPAIADFEHEVTGALDTFIGMLGLVARLRTHRDIVGYLEVPGPVGRVRNAATRSSGSDLADVIVDEEYRLMCEHLESSIKQTAKEAKTFQEGFAYACKQIEESSKVNADDMQAAARAGHYTLDDFRGDLLAAMDQLLRYESIQDYVPLGILQVDLRRLRAALIPSPKRCLKIINDLLPRLSAEKYKDFTKEIKASMLRLTQVPTSVEELRSHIESVQEVDKKRPTFDAQYDSIEAHYGLMAEFNIRVPDIEIAAYKTMEAEYRALLDHISYCQASTESLVMVFRSQIDMQVANLQKAVTDIRLMSDHDMVLDDQSVGRNVLEFLAPLMANTREQEQQAKTINESLVLFGLQPIKFTDVAEVAGMMSLKLSLWESQEEWAAIVSQWESTRFGELEIPDLEQTVVKYMRTVARLERGLMPNKVVPAFKARVQEWRDLVPLLSHLRNPDMKERHWMKIEAELGHNMERNKAFTLGHLLGLHITEVKEHIIAVSTEATNEAGLEALLRKVQDKWVHTEFVVNPYKDMKDMYVLGSVEDIMTVLDESFVMMASISSSRFIQGVRSEVSKLESNLKMFSNTLDEWLECQKNWVHLESIFSAPDIQRQLPKESKDFNVVARLFKDTMKRTKERPNAMLATTTPGLLETFQKCNTALEHIQNNLEAYLEVKRSDFPRFYFLSNDALLEILSQTKNPQAVHPHLQKCFDGIVSLDFGPNPKSNDIFAMNGVEGERVPLGRNLKARGNVEQWLSAVEHNMRQAMQILARKGWKSYPKANRLEWIQQQPSQLALVVSNIFWCTYVEDALAGNNPPAKLEQLVDFLVSNLQDLCSQVRTDMANLLRKVIVAMITIDVHNRDIVEQLFKGKVTAASDFAWQMHLRYYYNSELDQVIIRQSTASFMYGLEFLGAQPRLVVTPMTDRCYMTLTGALHMKLGGAPTGPAGTGKTETTKDLGKALGVQCVVFNCAENLDYKFMAKFFHGLAQCGAWACFDEFNRIDVEVLSVVAQQLMTIQNALRSHSSSFVFEGREIPLVESCGVVITQNPGYAGRSELPDNLKHVLVVAAIQALFRPVSMMIPDYALVAEVMLFSEGFLQASTLSRKMVMLYKLSSEQLSQQDHYDFGLRALKSVLVMAGALKRQAQKLSEDIVLIRAMRDANIPKFLSEDTDLFNAIVGDLFPGLEIPDQDYGDLKCAVVACSTASDLQPAPSFVLKVIQLYETINVRFGVMLVGPTGGGKSQVCKTLKNAMSHLRRQEHPNPKYQLCHMDVLFPKAINIGELYGEYNQLTSEWTDGLASTLVRHAVADSSSDWRWVVFDGPVDALWIENMNTVLDDTCTLCLPNGERIKLNADTMRMLFEVKDLSKASPATVSRCGMVYLPEAITGWRLMMQSWLACLDHHVSSQDKQVSIHETVIECLQNLFEVYVDKGLAFVREQCSEPVATSDINIVTSITKYMQSLLYRMAHPPKSGDIPLKNLTTRQLTNIYRFNLGEEMSEEMQCALEYIFCFSFVWGVGGAIESTCWDRFDEMTRNLFSGRVNFPQMPGTVFDFYVDPLKAWGFSHWEDNIPEFIYDAAEPYHEILVPTIDTARYSYMLQLSLHVKRGVLLTGISGVGKTCAMLRQLSAMTSEGIIPFTLNFSAQTTSKATQLFIESKLEKKRKNRYGAPYGKRVVLFVDDINMPQKEEYGAQPPIELLRQYQETSGFYDRKKLHWRHIEDMDIVAACAPPGGGRQELCSRFVRHFSVLCMPPPSEMCMRTIFESIMAGHAEAFAERVQKLVQPIVSSTVQLFLQLTVELLPTPAKSHYTFNLRDVSKVFQGILMLKPTKVTDANSNDVMSRIWIHEVMRVFHDRLNTKDDQELFKKKVYEMVKMRFELGLTYQDLFEGTPIMFGNYLHIGVAREEREYAHISEDQILKLPKLMDDYQDECNHVNSTPIALVFFQEAIDHISRLNRILAQPRGNAMIVGMGGCGKQSLARFAAFMQDMVCFQVETSRGYGHLEFREDLKKLYTIAGLDGNPVMLLLTDKQIMSDSQVEDVSNMLNSGEVRDLFQRDELEHIFAELRAYGNRHNLSESHEEMYNSFIKRVRNNLHIVLAVSPVGEGFRARCLRFPSLVNCCTIDWFSGWPAEALVSVSHIFLAKAQFSTDAKLTSSVTQMIVNVHTSVEEASKKFFTEVRRHVYVTPKSFLDFISLYVKLLSKRREEDILARDRLLSGLSKLHSTNETVARMKADLDALKPVLHERSNKTAELLSTVQAEREQAKVLLDVVSREEEEVLLKTDQTMDMKDEAQRDLEFALPALHDANRALSALNKSDITEIKSFSKPPFLVQLTMEGVCILLQERPEWDNAKRLLNDTTIVKRLMEYEKDSMPDNMLKRLRRVTDHPEFTPEQVAKQSNAARSMCLWVRAMQNYATVIKVVAPKRRALVEAEENLAEMQKQLQHKRKHLARINDEVDDLQQQLDTTQDELKDLQAQVNLSNERLQRASKLTAALGEESIRWEDTAKQISANMSLLGPYRDSLVKNWVDGCKEHEVPTSSEFSLQGVLVSPVEVRDWRMQGLPTDSISIDNAIMATRGDRWPMMVDPQSQANFWVKAMEARNGLQTIRYSDTNLLLALESAIGAGTPLLIEDCLEELDPVLDPLLTKQLSLQSGRHMIRFGDQDVEYNDHFRFYMTTKLANPHFLPEVSIKVNIINFTVTRMGLEDQLLGLVVRKERPELEEQKDRLVVSLSNDKRQLKELEEKILKMLEESKGNILDDEVLINTLNTSKLTSAVIKGRVKEAEQTEREIIVSRNEFRPVPVRGSILYFTIAELASVDGMYQYSLTYFTRLFSHCLEAAEPGADLSKRLENLINFSTQHIYKMVCRGLFDAHKLVFAFLVATSFERHSGDISNAHWNFLIRGGHSESTGTANPAPEWITPAMWQGVISLAELGYPFTALASSVKHESGAWKHWADSSDPYSMPLPVSSKLEELVTGFPRLLLVKVMREEKMVAACSAYVMDMLGKDILDTQAINLAEVYSDTSFSTPIIYILTAGVDPTPVLKRFAAECRGDDEGRELQIISLGQGQGRIAELTVRKACASGSWVCLQNCHLARSWMPELKSIVDDLQREYDIHEKFRLWLTSMPSPHFPVSVLQAGVKITMEPPKGLRANLRRSFANLPEGYLLACQKPVAWRKLVYSLVFFHAVIQERRKFGPLGWNIAYEFSDGDLSCSLETLQMFLNLSQTTIPWKALQYVLGDINYGGRVTDENDRRLLTCILRNYINQDVLKDRYLLSSESKAYMIPPDSVDFNDYKGFIKALPVREVPSVFSMHNNADISYQISESRKLIDVVLQIQPRVAENQDSAVASHDKLVCKLALELVAGLPRPLSAKAAPFTHNPFALLPSKHANSLATVLTQEMERFNRLLSLMDSMLQRLQSAVEGLVVMSPDLDDMYNAILNNQVPQVWAASAYPSLSPLASWMKDFKERMAFFNNWICSGQPGCFWLPAFFFPQGFLTAALQNHARINSIPIDQLAFRFLILKAMDETEVEGDVPDGILVKGLYLEGGAWDLTTGRLVESRQGEMHSRLPVIHFSPSQVTDRQSGLYQCPLYKTAVRAGTLSTTGQSTNFVVHINLPFQSGTTADTWILRGVAALCAPPE